MSLTQLLPLGIVSNEITGMTAAADGLHLLTEDGFYTLSKCEDTEMVSSEETTADTILRVGYCNDEVGNIQAALAAFAAENPQITLEAETYASHDELLIKIISGDVPDVLWFNGELATLQMLAGKGLLRELSSILTSIMKVFLNVEHSATNSMSCFRHSQLKYSPRQKQFFPKAVRLKLVNNSTNCLFRIVRTDMVGQPRILS